MSTVILYLATAAVFLLLDALMLNLVIAPLFRSHLGDAILDSPRIGPAAVFYLFYVAGILWLVSLPALREGAPSQALLNGAVLGALAYGTYEFTNFATLRNWSWQMVLTDFSWGIVLTAVSAWAGVTIARGWT